MPGNDCSGGVVLLSKSGPTWVLARRRDLPDQIAEQLTEMIIEGVLPPGGALPTEAELAKRYGVSRAVVREAIRVLQTRGMVGVRQGVSSLVNPAERWEFGQPLTLMVRSDQWPLGDWVEVRKVLETEAAALAARRADKEAVTHIRAALERMETTGGAPSETYAAADIDFHLQIAAAAHNLPLAGLMAPLLAPLHGRIVEILRWPDAATWSNIQHRKIFEAIARGDAAEAGAAMRHHLEHVAQEVERLTRDAELGNVPGLSHPSPE